MTREISYETLYGLLDDMKALAEADLLREAAWYHTKERKMQLAEGAVARLQALKSLRDRIELYRSAQK
jgi:predicted dinucleotide-utilizing enzyme